MTNPFIARADAGDLTTAELESLRYALGQFMDGETPTEPLFTDIIVDLVELPYWRVSDLVTEAEKVIGERLDREASCWPPRIERSREAAATVLSYYGSLCFIELPKHAHELSDLAAWADGDSLAALKAQARG